MTMAQTSTFTDSALSDKVKEFLIRFKDRNGNYKYVDAIDEMMPKSAKYIIVDYNDLVIEPQIEVIFSQNPDRILKLLLHICLIFQREPKFHSQPIHFLNHSL